MLGRGTSPDRRSDVRWVGYRSRLIANVCTDALDHRRIVGVVAASQIQNAVVAEARLGCAARYDQTGAHAKLAYFDGNAAPTSGALLRAYRVRWLLEVPPQRNRRSFLLRGAGGALPCDRRRAPATDLAGRGFPAGSGHPRLDQGKPGLAAGRDNKRSDRGW